jgi:hypothetical protein
MTEREEEKALLDKLPAAKLTEGGNTVYKLLKMRYERYKCNLVTTNSEETRGRAQECRELLKWFENGAG